MKVSGFTIVRNAIKYDYPVREALLSILPLCDEVVVAVGKSEDETLDYVKSIPSSKIKIIETEWDDGLREGGKVLAVETNKAFDAIDPQSDWAFYIQSDEVLPEKYIPAVKAEMEKRLNDRKVEGLLFRYTHFYGSYDYTGDSRKWYRREVRIIRNDSQIRSYKDAQGFRKNGQKLQVKLIDAAIYHYGWVKKPEVQQDKQRSFNKYWHPDEWVEQKVGALDYFDYSQIDSLQKFTGQHPRVMKERIDRMNWQFSFDPTHSKMRWKDRLLYAIEKRTGWRPFEYKNYRMI